MQALGITLLFLVGPLSACLTSRPLARHGEHGAGFHKYSGLNTNQTPLDQIGSDASVALSSETFLVPQAEELAAAEKRDQLEFQNELSFADHAQREDVQRWIQYFTQTDRSRFERFLQRGLKYKAVVETILKKGGVPTYFYYLAMIESGFYVQANSRAQAVGMWQFMEGTGLRYGLKVNRYLDERRDPIRSTIAAARYLSDLYNVFHSWFLAMAAYNAGERRIMNAIMSRGSRDFWQLAKLKALPPETRNYIPKFIAAALIGANPEAYGFSLQPSMPIPILKAVSVPAPALLSEIAASLNFPLASLREYNPQLLGEISPPQEPHYRLWLPELDPKLIAAAGRLKPLARYALSAPQSATYRVRRGDTLAAIARKFGSNLNQLMTINRISPRKRLRAGDWIKIPPARQMERLAHSRR